VNPNPDSIIEYALTNLENNSQTGGILLVVNKYNVNSSNGTVL